MKSKPRERECWLGDVTLGRVVEDTCKVRSAPTNVKKNYSKYPMIHELKPFLNAKEIISFFLAPAVPVLLWFASWGELSYEHRAPLSSWTLMWQCIILMVIYAIAAGHAFLLGVPAYLLGKRLNAIRWWTCVLVAFLIGGLPITILTGWGEFISIGLFGVSAGFAFWLLWRFWI